MKAPVLASFAMLLAVAACGGAKKDADNPSNTEDTASTDDGGGATAAAEAPAHKDTPVGNGPPVGGDDTAKKAPCGGFEVADLAATLGQPDCEVSGPASTDQKDLKDILEIKVIPDSAKIAPGGTATITVTYKNKGAKELPLDFVVDPEPRFDFEVYSLKGDRVDQPKGAEPALPPEVQNAPQPEQKVARIKLAQNGTAKLTLKWNAVQYKWASPERAKGALPGHGYPKEPGTPLKKGAYVLRVITPLTGVFEGGDHELSQPRVQVNVAK